MEVLEHHKWMDKRMGSDNSRVTNEYMAGVAEFVDFACVQENYKREGKLRCPCNKCKCLKYQLVDDVRTHLCMKGCMSGYYYWTNHSEQRPPFSPTIPNNYYYGSGEAREGFNEYEQLVIDSAGPSISNYLQQQGFDSREQMREDPNPEAKKFFEMLAAAQAPLYNGCESYSELSTAGQALSIKSEFNMSQSCFNRWADFVKNALPEDNKMPKNFYHAKKSVQQLG